MLLLFVWYILKQYSLFLLFVWYVGIFQFIVWLVSRIYLSQPFLLSFYFQILSKRWLSSPVSCCFSWYSLENTPRPWTRIGTAVTLPASTVTLISLAIGTFCGMNIPTASSATRTFLLTPVRNARLSLEQTPKYVLPLHLILKMLS